MGVVTAYRKRHWTGLDADLASVPNPQIGDSYLATDKNKLYYWEGGAWKTGLGYEYVPRAVTTHDFDKTAFITDGTSKVNGLDLTGIVPVGAKAVHLLLEIADDAAGNYFSISQNAVNIGNKITVYTQVANIYNLQHSFVAIDTDRLMDYVGSNVVFTAIFVYVLGWVI